MRTTRFATLIVLALAAVPVFAAPPCAPAAATAQPMPSWEQLTPAQRDLLIAPMRDRWNANPDARGFLWQHAQRWQQMTPEQRAHAHKGFRRWEQMPPEKREAMRALFHRMRDMSPEQRKALREQWRSMTPEQRKQWVEQNRPEGGDPGGSGR